MRKIIYCFFLTFLVSCSANFSTKDSLSNRSLISDNDHKVLELHDRSLSGNRKLTNNKLFSGLKVTYKIPPSYLAILEKNKKLKEIYLSSLKGRVVSYSKKDISEFSGVVTAINSISYDSGNLVSTTTPSNEIYLKKYGDYCILSKNKLIYRGKYKIVIKNISTILFNCSDYSTGELNKLKVSDIYKPHLVSFLFKTGDKCLVEKDKFYWKNKEIREKLPIFRIKFDCKKNLVNSGNKIILKGAWKKDNNYFFVIKNDKNRYFYNKNLGLQQDVYYYYNFGKLGFVSDDFARVYSFTDSNHYENTAYLLYDVFATGYVIYRNLGNGVYNEKMPELKSISFVLNNVFLSGSYQLPSGAFKVFIPFQKLKKKNNKLKVIFNTSYGKTVYLLDLDKYGIIYKKPENKKVCFYLNGSHNISLAKKNICFLRKEFSFMKKFKAYCKKYSYYDYFGKNKKDYEYVGDYYFCYKIGKNYVVKFYYFYQDGTGPWYYKDLILDIFGHKILYTTNGGGFDDMNNYKFLTGYDFIKSFLNKNGIESKIYINGFEYDLSGIYLGLNEAYFPVNTKDKCFILSGVKLSQNLLIKKFSLDNIKSCVRVLLPDFESPFKLGVRYLLNEKYFYKGPYNAFYLYPVITGSIVSKICDKPSCILDYKNIFKYIDLGGNIVAIGSGTHKLKCEHITNSMLMCSPIGSGWDFDF